MLIIYIYLDVSFKKKIYNSVSAMVVSRKRWGGVADLVFCKFGCSIGVPDQGSGHFTTSEVLLRLRFC